MRSLLSAVLAMTLTLPAGAVVKRIVHDSEKIIGPCLTTATRLCISDEPGDNRFQVEIDFETAAGDGAQGQGRAIALSALDVRSGGMFWFFSQDNPELLIKVLNGCSQNGHYWVFWSAGTTAGLTVNVTDLVDSRTVVYTNPDGQVPEPVTDRFAFPCQ